MIQWLVDQCQQHPLTEKWLLAEQLRIAQQWKDRVNLRGCSTINLHSQTLPTITLSLVSRQLADSRLSFAGESTVRMLVRNVFCRLLDAGELGYFNSVESVGGLCDLVARSIRDLRLADVQPESIVADAFDSPAKAADVHKLYAAYRDLLANQQVVDYAACIELARDGLRSGSIELPAGLVILMPETSRWSHAERSLLRTLAAQSTLLHPEHLDVFSIASEQLSDRLTGDQVVCEYFSGFGETNEIRGVFQKILRPTSNNPSRLDDTEILHTDYQQYVPLVLEQLTTWLAVQDGVDNIGSDLDKLPVTFAEGIACIYSRPGRALRGWLRWARHEFVQARAVQLIREGLLVRPPQAEKIGYSRLANALRQVPIGFQAERYLPKISESIQSAQQAREEYQQRGDLEAGEVPADAPTRCDFGSSALLAISMMVEPLVKLAPGKTDDCKTVLRKASNFLRGCARAANKLDRYAREKLLADIDGMLTILDWGWYAELDVVQWLEDLPVESRIMASGPRPGRVHVASLQTGGHSGRKQIFVVGLDDAKYPQRIPIDPVVLDAERERLSTNLQTSKQAADDAQRALDRALCRVLSNSDARVCLSFSNTDLVEDRAMFPSAAMLEMFRITEGKENAQVDDLLTHIGPPVAFVSRAAEDQLSAADGQLAKLLAGCNEAGRQPWLEQQFTHAKFQRIASESHRQPQLTEYDGLVPVAGSELDPSNAQRVSPSRLETYGVCPRRFFFARGLGVYPPEEWIVDRERWLNPLQLGNLLHQLFEQFLGTLTRQELTPDIERDLPSLLELLHVQIEEWKSDIPIPNEDAYRRTCDWLQRTCEIFLAKEQEYCREYDARPWVLEAAIGLDDEPSTELDCRQPIPLTLSNGRIIRLGGRLDRVDKLMSSGSERYAIWDYKSGSSYGFDQAKPFNQGRKLQPYLYVGMLRHRLAALGGGTDAVDSFGYFFPSPQTDGLRLRWTRAELRSGDDILKQMCDLIAGGIFVPTTDTADCTYCDYLSVCGDAQLVTQQSLWKSSQSRNEMLQPWRRLRDIDPCGEAS
jgi:ATP-dependent helicase/nuclease subunit B